MLYTLRNMLWYPKDGYSGAIFWRWTSVAGRPESDLIPEPHELPNKPLVEAIFELRWALKPGDHPGVSEDPGFKILYGRYYDRMRKDYPHLQDLPAARIPEELTGHTVRHQFWRAKGEWPVTQLGPGILTVNETQTYRWSTFRPRLIEAINALFGSYPTDIQELRLVQASLKYIDSTPFDPATSDEDLLGFVRDAMHADIRLDPCLFETQQQAESPRGFSLHLAYPLSRPQGAVVFTIGNGATNSKPSIIWEINVHSRDAGVPQSPPGFADWLDAAHDLTDRWFFTLTRGRLMRIFENTDGNSPVSVRD